MAPVIRPMRWWHLPEVATLDRAAFPEDAWTPAMFWSELADRACCRYLILVEPTAAVEEVTADSGSGPAAGGGAPGRLVRAGAAAGVPAETASGVDGRIIGYGGVSAVAGEAEIRTIAVAAERRGRGFGALLLETLLREAARRGCDEAFLEVRVDNKPAQRLYERYGFAGVGIRRGYYQPANVDAVIMRRHGLRDLLSDERRA